MGKAELDHATLRATIAIFLEDEQGQDETINGLIATAITEHNEKIEEHIRNLNQNKEHLPDVQYEATLAGYQRNKIDSENYQGYVNYIKQADTHAGNPECQAVLASYQVNIQIIMEGSLYASFPPKKIEEFPTIYLLYTGNHYDLGVPVTDQ